MIKVIGPHLSVPQNVASAITAFSFLEHAKTSSSACSTRSRGVVPSWTCSDFLMSPRKQTAANSVFVFSWCDLHYPYFGVHIYIPPIVWQIRQSTLIDSELLTSRNFVILSFRVLQCWCFSVHPHSPFFWHWFYASACIASSTATAEPIPEGAPVIKTNFPARFIFFLLLTSVLALIIKIACSSMFGGAN